MDIEMTLSKKCQFWENEKKKSWGVDDVDD